MISKTGNHAIRALVVLARLPRDESAGAAALARRTGAPANYLGKLLRTLARDGLLVSQKGAGGGFRLARSPRSIRLIDVIERIEHVHRWNECILGRPECSEDDPCAVHHRWAPVRDAYLALLSETTIADLVDPDTDGNVRSAQRRTTS